MHKNNDRQRVLWGLAGLLLIISTMTVVSLFQADFPPTMPGIQLAEKTSLMK